MKVCTDACIFGAWYAQRIQHAQTVLDIGSGTGLLMMMLAQQSAADIHGIEIEDGCYQQLQQNISGHHWSGRMKIFHGDVRVYKFPVKYDFIISNPPFYDRDLSSANNGRQLAMHSSALKLDELATAISDNLTATGSAGILLPAHRAEAFDQAATKVGLTPSGRLFIRHTAEHSWFRTITTYVRSNAQGERGTANLLHHHFTRETPEASEAQEQTKASVAARVILHDELTIRDTDGTYTDKFMSLLCDYYL